MKYRAVLVGCGGISNAWIKPLLERSDVRLVALVDQELSRAEQKRMEHDLADIAVSSDLEATLQELQADILFDCTVPEAHESVTMSGLQHGCHVLGEKPLATSMPAARRMVGSAENSNRTYAVMQNRRYLQGVVKLKRLIDSGAIGQLTTLNADFYLGPHFGGFREEMEHVLLMDMAIHTFDQARFVSGCDAHAVYCHEWNPANSWYRHGASAMAIFEMSRDVVFNYRGSWCSPGLATSWECAWKIIGTEGSAWWDGHDLFQAERAMGQEGFMPPVEALSVAFPAPLLHEGHRGAIFDFLDCLGRGEAPQTECHDNIKSLAMVLGAIRSANRRERVAIEGYER